ncbi:MAG: M48 family metallopeptidase [Rhodobacteraceae bacterium]|nr:M48 family metallopeptidase [Paracoccaceae bacterium]
MPVAETVDIGSPPIVVELRRNASAKRMTLRVSAVDGAARLTLPKRASLRTAKRFLLDQEEWLRGNIDKTPARVALAPDMKISLGGESFLLATHSGARVVLAPGKIFLPQSRPFGKALEGFIKMRARHVITNLVEADCRALGRPFAKLSLRDPRSRWGSCNSDGNLMFSWRLFLAPCEVLRYVVAHEVAHLAEMNHSKDFWAEVAGLMPDYAAPRRWLKQNGGQLHRFDFKTP